MPKKRNCKKSPFLDQNHGLIPLEKCQFFDFLNFLFYSVERRIFVREYHKRHFSGLYCLKKKSWKHVNFSTFQTSRFYSLQRRFFVLEYYKRHFPGLCCLKKKIGKMAIFRPKPWVNPFRQMSNFRLFKLLVFIAYKGIFSF